MTTATIAQAFLYPPRPGGSLQRGDLDYYEKTRNWVAQPKYNESRIFTHVLPDGEVVFWTRHGTRPSKFDFAGLARQVRETLKFRPGVEYWIDGGIMNREKNAGGELVFYDLLFAGRYLFLRPTRMERLEMLFELCGQPQEANEEQAALRIGGHLWMAPVYTDDFVATLNRLVGVPYIEGLVLRKAASHLDNFGRVQYEAAWMKRCRVK